MTDRHGFEIPNQRPIMDRLEHQRLNGIQNPVMFMRDIEILYHLKELKRQKKVFNLALKHCSRDIKSYLIIVIITNNLKGWNDRVTP